MENPGRMALDGSAIVTRGLTKRFGKLIAVRDLNLAVGRGDIFGFLGPNGAGKSTTIRMLLGLVRPTAGEARVFGHDVQRNPLPALRRVGALVETPAFYDYLSGRKNLEILARMSGGASRERIHEALRLVGLEARGSDRVANYSHGMRQRLALAQALLPSPELLILDEPAAGLDPEGLHDVRTILSDLAAKGIAIFLSSHLLHEVELICTHVGLIRNGSLIASGRTAELLRSPHERLRVLADDPQRALAVLRGLSAVAEAALVHQEPAEALGGRDSRWVEVVAPRESAATINAALVREDIAISALIPASLSLEEFYLQVTGGEGSP